jgi:hypothetical protein
MLSQLRLYTIQPSSLQHNRQFYLHNNSMFQQYRGHHHEYTVRRSSQAPGLDIFAYVTTTIIKPLFEAYYKPMCGPRNTSVRRRITRWSAGGFGRKCTAKMVSDTEWIKNTRIYVCAKTSFVTLTTGMVLLLFTCMHIWAWRILRRWYACAPTAYEVVRNCRNFEKQWYKCWTALH